MDKPVLLRIPFSHYCRKAEWGLTQAGIAYDAIDVPLWKMTNAKRANPAHATVPVLRVGARLLSDSHSILVWADEHRDAGAKPLYPEAFALAVARWEMWAGEAIGPCARREAYRAIYKHPSLGRRYGVPAYLRAPFLAKRLVLGVLKHYKARRTEASDPGDVVAAMEKVAAQLAQTATGYLFGSEPTAADITTAALLEPLRLVDAHHKHAAWEALDAYIERVKPKKTLCAAEHKVREADWVAFERVAAAELAAREGEHAAAAA